MIRGLLRGAALIGVGILAVIIALPIGSARSAPDEPSGGDDEEMEAFVRPLDPVLAGEELFGDLGFKWMALKYRAPEGSKVVFKFIARDENGKLIREWTRRSFKTTVNEGTLRILFCNPAEFIEDYKGRTRWIIKLGVGGGEVSWAAWTPNPLKVDGGVTAWGTVKTIGNPEPGNQYVVWRCGSRKQGEAKQTPLCHFEVRFKYEPARPGEEGTEPELPEEELNDDENLVEDEHTAWLKRP